MTTAIEQCLRLIYEARTPPDTIAVPRELIAAAKRETEDRIKFIMPGDDPADGTLKIHGVRFVPVDTEP